MQYVNILSKIMEVNSGSLYLSMSVLISECLRKHVDVNKKFLFYRNILDHYSSQGNLFHRETCFEGKLVSQLTALAQISLHLQNVFKNYYICFYCR